MEFRTVCQKSGHVVMVLQGILVELNIIFLQGSRLVFWVPNWFHGCWYSVHCVGVHIFRVAQGLFKGLGFGFSFRFGFGFKFSIRFSFAERIV
jgi:hypothetical protein